MFVNHGLSVSLIIFLLSLNSYSNGTSSNTWWTQVSTRYPKYIETTQIIQSIVKTYPEIASYYSAGKSVVGREMWVIHLTENIRSPRQLLKPMVKQCSSMHGDEVVGRALLLMLAVDIVKRYSEGDQRIVNLLKTTDIHLMPSVNPDGFEVAVKECAPNATITGRRNQNSVDLNRDFPDQFIVRNESDPLFYSNRQPETLNMMRYIKKYPFVLSTNLHGGDVVACYPFDSVPEHVKNLPGYQSFGVPSFAPDNLVLKHLAREYARNHRTMTLHPRNRVEDIECPTPEGWPEGITNGAEWYNVEGGMQDFNYVHSNCFEITVELSCCKYPNDSTLIEEWHNNNESLYTFMESAHMGVKGFVKSVQGKPIKDALIKVKNINKAIKTTTAGEYWRLLVPGTYEIGAVAENYEPSPLQVIQIQEGITSRIDFSLHPTAHTGPRFFESEVMLEGLYNMHK